MKKATALNATANTHNVGDQSDNSKDEVNCSSNLEIVNFLQNVAAEKRVNQAEKGEQTIAD